MTPPVYRAPNLDRTKYCDHLVERQSCPECREPEYAEIEEAAMRELEILEGPWRDS